MSQMNLYLEEKNRVFFTVHGEVLEIDLKGRHCFDNSPYKYVVSEKSIQKVSLDELLRIKNISIHELLFRIEEGLKFKGLI